MAVDNREDCYFFLHGGCTKGNLCQYRHSDAVLNTINVCTDWMNTKVCNNENCELRHSTYHLAIPIIPQTDPRSSVPCYWEQNGGCKKHHCPYKHKNSSFPAFRPPGPPVPPTSFNPAAKSFAPRPPKVSHNQTLILNNSTPQTTPVTVNSETIPRVPKPVVRPMTEVPRPSVPSLSSGIQIKNISNNTSKPFSDPNEAYKAQISFKSSNPASCQPGSSTKSVFERLSVKPDSGLTKIRDKIPAKKVVKNTSPKKTVFTSPKDSFTEIKVKSLQEILKAKKEKQAKQVDPAASSSVSIASEISLPQQPSPVVNNGISQGVKRALEEKPTETKRLKADTPPSGDLDDFGSDFEGAEFSDPGDNLLDIDLDGDLADI